MFEFTCYHIYYLPNAVRTYTNAAGDTITIRGKIGLSGQRYASSRKWGNTQYGLDTEGHRVIMDGILSKEAAKQWEQYWQKVYQCVEPTQSWIHKGMKIPDHILQKRIGRKHSQETKDKIAEARRKK